MMKRRRLLIELDRTTVYVEKTCSGYDYGNPDIFHVLRRVSTGCKGWTMMDVRVFLRRIKSWS
jgi:hypothetical protein